MSYQAVLSQAPADLYPPEIKIPSLHPPRLYQDVVGHTEDDEEQYEEKGEGDNAWSAGTEDRPCRQTLGRPPCSKQTRH